MPERDRILGVNISAGVAYLVLIARPSTSQVISPTQCVPAEAMPLPRRLSEFERTFRAEMRRHRVQAVAIAQPLRPNRWVFSEAFNRSSLETAIILAADAEGVAYHPVELHAALTTCGIPQPGKGGTVPKQAAAHLATAHTALADEPHWDTRCGALLAALAVELRGQA